MNKLLKNYLVAIRMAMIKRFGHSPIYIKDKCILGLEGEVKLVDENIINHNKKEQATPEMLIISLNIYTSTIQCKQLICNHLYVK